MFQIVYFVWSPVVLLLHIVLFKAREEDRMKNHIILAGMLILTGSSVLYSQSQEDNVVALIDQALRLDGTLAEKIDAVVTVFNTTQAAVQKSSKLKALKTIFQMLQKQLQEFKKRKPRKRLELELLDAAAGVMNFGISIPTRLQTAACLLQAGAAEAGGAGVAPVGTALQDALDRLKKQQLFDYLLNFQLNLEQQLGGPNKDAAQAMVQFYNAALGGGGGLGGGMPPIVSAIQGQGGGGGTPPPASPPAGGSTPQMLMLTQPSGNAGGSGGTGSGSGQITLALPTQPSITPPSTPPSAPSLIAPPASMPAPGSTLPVTTITVPVATVTPSTPPAGASTAVANLTAATTPLLQVPIQAAATPSMTVSQALQAAMPTTSFITPPTSNMQGGPSAAALIAQQPPSQNIVNFSGMMRH